MQNSSIYGRRMGSYQYSGMRSRISARASDIEESRILLLELTTYEPVLQQCFKIIESTCLSQGIYCKVDGSEVTSRFQRHLDDFWAPFCRQAIHAFFTYGFAPWRVRRVSRGDYVPEIIPAGCFEWHTEIGPVEQGKNPRFQDKPNENWRIKYRYTDDDTLMVVYRVKPTTGSIKEEDINIYIYQQPTLDVSTGSLLHATVPSPLSHVLTDYKNLRQAQIRRSHADAWNCQAKVISEFKPQLRVEDNPNMHLMDFVHESFYDTGNLGNAIFPPLEAHNVWQRESIMRQQFDNLPTTHLPDVYALPRDHTVSTQHMLAPCEDLDWLWGKFRRDVAGITGVPYEMIAGREGGMGAHETVRKTVASGRLFSTNMHQICRHIQLLLVQVYKRVYGQNADVEFRLIPMPRLEIETIADFKTLFEIGALTPDMSVKLSRILLGEGAGMSKKVTVSNAIGPAGSGSKLQGDSDVSRPEDADDDEEDRRGAKRKPGSDDEDKQGAKRKPGSDDEDKQGVKRKKAKQGIKNK